MSQQGAKHAYDNGLLRSNVKQLQTQLESVPALLGELAQLRKTNVATEAKYAKVCHVAHRWMVLCLPSEAFTYKVDVI